MNLGNGKNNNKHLINIKLSARKAYDVAHNALDKLKSIMSSAVKLSNKGSENSSITSR